jgi:putative oxidoreductase
MKKILATNPADSTALVARLAVGIVVFPHGAQSYSAGLAATVLVGRWNFLQARSICLPL